MAVRDVALAQTQGRNRPGSDVEGRLGKEFQNAYLLATSPDARLMCLYFTQHPQDTFTFKHGTVQRDGANNTRDSLQVIELGSWKTIYSAQLRQKALNASFFADSRRLYIETLGIPDQSFRSSQNGVVNLLSGVFDERTQPVHPNGLTTYYSALAESILLGAEFNGQTGRYSALNRVGFPEYEEIARKPFFIEREHEPLGHDTDVVVSTDRNTLGYANGHAIVCRRTATLDVIWTSQVEPEYFGAVRVAIAANGSRVAASVLDTTFIEQQRRYYIAVFDGEDGRILAKLPLKGGEGIAISPDGRLIAVGERINPAGTTKEVQLTISLMDIDSGRRVERFAHDRFSIGQGEWVNSHFGIGGLQFSSDGKYLITSGNNRVKIWPL